MTTANARLWSRLEGWRVGAFVTAGVLLLASPTHVALDLFLGVGLPAWVVAMFVFPGLGAALVGVAGVYPRIAPRAPWLSRAAGVCTAVAGTILLTLLGWVLGGSISAAVGMPPSGLFLGLAVALTLSFLLFGITSLRWAVPSRTVGVLLLAFGLPWLVSLAGTAVYGTAFPQWLTMAIYGPIPLLMFATGYALRIEAGATDHTDPSLDLAAG